MFFINLKKKKFVFVTINNNDARNRFILKNQLNQFIKERYLDTRFQESVKLKIQDCKFISRKTYHDLRQIR